MSKQKDLKLIFQFIADYLREEVDISEVKAIPEIDDNVLNSLEKQSSEDKKSNRIVQIMNRLDDMDKAKTMALNMITQEDIIRKNLQLQLQDLRNEHNLMVSEDAIAEEKELNKNFKFSG